MGRSASKSSQGSMDFAPATHSRGGGEKVERQKTIPCPFVIISDTREQSPYTFCRVQDDSSEVNVDAQELEPYEFQGVESNADQGRAIIDITKIRVGLPQGDYAVFGLPGMVVERKSKEDLFGSVARRENFKRRLEKMTELERIGFVVVEAEYSEIMTNPPPRSKMNIKSLVRTIMAWEQRFPMVHWKFLPGRAVAEQYTFRLLERWYLDHRDQVEDAVHRDPATGVETRSIPTL